LPMSFYKRPLNCHPGRFFALSVPRFAVDYAIRIVSPISQESEFSCKLENSSRHLARAVKQAATTDGKCEEVGGIFFALFPDEREVP
jgi:hypothetical protein